MHSRSGRSQNVSPPSIVPGASIRADGRDAPGVQPGLDEELLALSVRLARPERDRAPVGHEERVELVDEVGRVALGVELVDRRAEAGQELGERVVLAPGDVEVDRMEEAVGRVVERPAEGRPGPLDQDVAERGGHALGAERSDDLGRRLHGCRIAAREGWPTAGPGSRLPRMAGYVAVAILGAAEIRVDRPGDGRALGRGRAVPPADHGSPIEDIRVVRSLASEQLHERAATLRRIWDQTTFYLFDPQSWR